MNRSFGMFYAHKFLLKVTIKNFAFVPYRYFAIFASTPKQVKSFSNVKYMLSSEVTLFSNNNPKFENYLSFHKMPVINHNMAACGDGILESSHSDVFLFTSESVGEGHPDKMCDQVMSISFFFFKLG